MMMTTDAAFGHSRPARKATRALRTVVVAGNDPDERVLDTVADAGDYDVVIVEPTASAYSKIKRVAPNVVIVCFSFEDADAFQLISMLKLDHQTRSIPVVPCFVES